MFPLCDRLAVVLPRYCLSDRCVQHPPGTLAMRLPAPQSIPKWYVERTLRSTKAPSDALPRVRHRVILAWLRALLLGSARIERTGYSPTLVSRASPYRRSPARDFAASSLLENCHIGLARVTMLVTIASATRALGHDLNFVSLFSRQKLATRVSTRHAGKFAGAVTPVCCSADENT